MDIYHDALNLSLHDTAVAIGVFDGVHLGHQAVLHQVTAAARSKGLQSVALTFDIHPSRLLAPKRAPATITTLAQRSNLMRRFGGGLDALVTEAFTRSFASLSPEAFVNQILLGRLGARAVFVGADFRYGKDREGDAESLIASGAEHGFTVAVVPPISIDGDRVSSTRIRTLIESGDVISATKLLGHEFAVAGHVQQGKMLGRELGFPTANLAPTDFLQLIPADGVYAGYAAVAGVGRNRAAISLGTNPTTDDDGKRKVEAYLLDGFDLDIYGASIELEFTELLRGQIKFESLEALKDRIAADVVWVEQNLPR